MKEIILIGGGGHAISCIDVIEESKKFKISGIVDNDKSIVDSLGYYIIGKDSDLKKLREKYEFAFIAIGQIKSPKIRIDLFNRLKKLNYKLPRVISPRAHVSNHSIVGEGTIIMHDAIVNANASVGFNCIINNKALIEHDAKIANNCHISTGAIINGSSVINDNCFIGSGSVIKEEIEIGRNCVISASSFVRKNINPNLVIKNNE